MKYGFIGCGNMGGAVAKALAKKCSDFSITDRSGRAVGLAVELCCGYTSAEEIALNAQRIFLAVKPQMMAGVLESLRPILQDRKPVLITMAAGLTMDQIQDMCECDLPVIRIMPNTPVAVGQGLTLYCANDLVEPEVLDDFLRDIECSGAVACGVPRKQAMEYAAVTMLGAAEMLLQSGQHPGALKDAVCSPGGSTIAGVKALEDGNFRATVMNCIMAAARRNSELGK